MFRELCGDVVQENIETYIKSAVAEFGERGIVPKLAVIRAGEDSGQQYYETAILKQSAEYGIETQAIRFTSNISQALIDVTLEAVNEDEGVHGIIMLRPLPEGLDEEKLRKMLNPAKDVDAITDISIAELFTGKKDAFYACTAEACMEILDHYGIDPAGRKVTILGRSLTVGKPLAIMMLNRDATITVCHSATPREDLIRASREADIVVLATGMTQAFGSTVSKIDNHLIEAAYDLGASKVKTYTKVILPLSVPGIVSGITMVFIPALTTFVISNMLGGGKINLIGNIIEQEFTVNSNWYLGSGLSLVMMVFIIFSMVLLQKFDKTGGANLI